jgi:accessory colonization factor AcfC
MRRRHALLLPALLAPAVARSQAAPVRCYGGGGPGPAMRAAAEAFTARRGTAVEVVAGPVETWAARARTEADLLFSASRHQFESDFQEILGPLLDAATARPALWRRPALLLARPGNPRGYRDLPDILARPPAEARLLLTEGEEEAGAFAAAAERLRPGLGAALRARVVVTAANSGEAQRAWREQPVLDAWLGWRQRDAVPASLGVEVAAGGLDLARESGIVLTRRGAARAEARAFAAFLETAPEAAAAFARHGLLRVS